MKAFVYEVGEWKLKEMEDPVPGPGEAVVSLKVSGLNRRDLYIPGRIGPDKEAVVIGSDGAGVVSRVGEGVSRFKEGDEVIINPALGWMEQSAAPPASFEILGMPDNGTMAEKIVLPADQLEPKPASLSWEEAGVLSLAAMTGYRALVTRGQIEDGQTVFIPGAGSGVATYLIQFAKALGARVLVSSRSADKRNRAVGIGADRAIDTNADWKEELKDETIDLVIDSVGEATFNRSLEVLKKGGRIVTFGATTNDHIHFDLRSFFYGQYDLLGSTMGNREELRALLKLMEEKDIHPIVDSVYPLGDILTAMDKLENSTQFGKVAIRIME
ncbi:zinc-binding dehydrogenase [Bhargavaea beijingensis]|uniref:NAD(P)-dependent alcohol dehydrogenase n=1 Tax=Bhargavaea beijingensis TaxID=426756 RepID=A0A1G7D6Z1_9BACL|nr:zinc-binding dehydrogenase [Bhargavaea beijingensis]MCW1929196.1 zinc-binding dehydrogenase [Bhargavaea beijingensis]RSK24483.1 NAD(P)-dependent alcohol dehydrogenase [Bhargavaea beijingensis]SDE47414.1 zinc-binding alcohol dehydrogenase/oxidoreductase [Bhargavaea beijingensis]